MNLYQILETWEEEPPIVRFKELRKDKYQRQQEKEKLEMGRPHTNIKRQKPMGAHGLECCEPGPKGEPAKQYKQTGPKATGPNYPDKSVTGPLQNGGYGGKGAK